MRLQGEIFKTRDWNIMLVKILIAGTSLAVQVPSLIRELEPTCHNSRLGAAKQN